MGIQNRADHGRLGGQPSARITRSTVPLCAAICRAISEIPWACGESGSAATKGVPIKGGAETAVRKETKEAIVIWLPAVSGMLLVGAAALDLLLLEKGLITSGRQAVGHEMIFLLSGFLGLFAQLYFGVKWLLAKRWKPILLSMVSGGVFFASLVAAASFGAAIFYAT